MKVDYTSIYRQIREEQEHEEHGLKHITRPDENIFLALGFEPDEAERLLAHADELIEERRNKNRYKLFLSKLPSVDISFHHDLEDGWYTAKGHHSVDGDWSRWTSLKEQLIENNLKGNWVSSHDMYKPENFENFWWSVWQNKNGRI